MCLKNQNVNCNAKYTKLKRKIKSTLKDIDKETPGCYTAISKTAKDIIGYGKQRHRKQQKGQAVHSRNYNFIWRSERAEQEGADPASFFVLQEVAFL